MNIAEIRKKAKKKKEELPKTENTPIQKEEQPSALPILAQSGVPEPVEKAFEEDMNFLDEENLYNKYSAKEDRTFKEFLCFKLGTEEYGIDVSLAKEIIKNRAITEVPKTMDFILGVISIRGEVFPVFDLKKILAIDSDSISITAKIIIIDYNGEKVSLIVDSISQIKKIPNDAIEATPMNLTGAKQEFIKGVAMIDNKMIRILDIEKILNF